MNQKGICTVSIISAIMLKRYNLTCFIQSGGIAGTAVDVILFPLDTIKTRMQSAEGFFKAGGFKRIYSGLGSAAAGSAPGGMCKI